MAKEASIGAIEKPEENGDPDATTGGPHVERKGGRMSPRMVNHPFPDIIRKLPEASIAQRGVRGWISQGKNHQIVFFEIAPTAKIPDHVHGAQWGIVVDGEMELTIDGITRTYEKGCFYYIPDGAVHSAVFKTRTFALDFFANGNRYQIKA